MGESIVIWITGISIGLVALFAVYSVYKDIKRAQEFKNEGEEFYKTMSRLIDRLERLIDNKLGGDDAEDR